MAGGSLAEQASLKAELSELKAKIREARREVGGIPAPVASSVGASPSNAANGDSELRQLDKKAALPPHAVRLADDNKFTKNGWVVVFCDPTLPEAAVGEEDPQ